MSEKLEFFFICIKTGRKLRGESYSLTIGHHCQFVSTAQISTYYLHYILQHVGTYVLWIPPVYFFCILNEKTAIES